MVPYFNSHSHLDGEWYTVTVTFQTQTGETVHHCEGRSRIEKRALAYALEDLTRRLLRESL